MTEGNLYGCTTLRSTNAYFAFHLLFAYAVEGVTEGCRIATVLPGGTPGRRAPDDCSRAAEVHISSGFEDKLADIEKYRWSPELVGQSARECRHPLGHTAFLPTKGRRGALGTMPRTLPHGLRKQDHGIN